MKLPLMQIEPNPGRRGLHLASILLFVLGSIAGNLSFFWHFDMNWRGAGIRREIWAGSGRFIWIRFDQCKLPDDGKIWYGIERSNPFKRFVNRRSKDNDPWEGEPVGYEVASKFRLFGFEYATGEYWPPFVWRHRRMPFWRSEAPIWLLSILGGIYPVTWYVRRKLRLKCDRYLVDNSIASHDESQKGK